MIAIVYIWNIPVTFHHLQAPARTLQTPEKCVPVYPLYEREAYKLFSNIMPFYSQVQKNPR